MLTKIWLVVVFASVVSAQVPPQSSDPGPPASGLESFYVVVFGDNTPFRIVDVRPATGASSLVRLIEVHQACGTYHVKSDNYLFKDMSVQELAGQADLCGPEEALIRQVRAAKKKDGNIAAHQYAIAAQCGSQTVFHHLPWSTEVKFDRMDARLADLWSLANTIPLKEAQSLAPAGDPAQAKLERHGFAEQAAIDIRGGSFDLAESVLPEQWQEQGKLRLSDFVPEVAEATAPDEDFGVVGNLDELGLEKFEPIQYPGMAKIAHIEGNVTLEVSIDRESGSPTAVNVLSGHPLLGGSARGAIERWVFPRPYLGANPLPLTVHFAVHCPPMIEATDTHAGTKQKKPKKKPKQ